jgi:hypothetical protein
MAFTPLVVCIDVGSTTSGKFGWACSSGATGTTPSGVAQHIAEALNSRGAVALGFECPLFVPLAEKETDLTRSRPGEGDRPWSAAAGLGALGVGITQVPWVLREVRRQLTRTCLAFLDWTTFRAAGCGLFLWEAFVSDKAKRSTHVGDAEAAVQAFLAALPEPPTVHRLGATSCVLSLVGAALIRTGWSNDLSLLGQPVLVIGPA